MKKNHADTFKEYPILAFRRNKNLKDLIGQNKVVKNKIFKNIKQSKRKMFTLSFWKNNFCCKQMLNANIVPNKVPNKNIFESSVTNKKCAIFHAPTDNVTS